MNIRLKQLISSLIIACMMAVIMPLHLMTALAAEAKISFSDPSVMVGKEVNVTMKISSVGGEPLGGADVTLSYDPSVLEFVGGSNASGGAGSVRLIGSMDSANTTSFKFTLKFKALQAGKTKIAVARQEVNDINTQPVALARQGDSTVNVTPLATYSTDAALKSLKIDPGTLTPQFSTDVTEYTATVGGDVSKLVVSAGTSNANAKVVISGTDLKIGENTVVCKVTAEDGQTVKKYTIKVTKTEEAVPSSEAANETQAIELGDVKATIDGTEYSVAASFDASLLPEGFQAGKATYQDSEVASAVGNGTTLLYLVDAGGNGSFYVYDEAAGTLIKFTKISAEGMTIVPTALEEGVTVPQGFVESSIEIEGQSVSGWEWNSEGKEAPYFVFYAMNSSGEKDFYRYDVDQKTIQRYFQDPNADTGVSTEQYVDVAQKYNSLIKDYKIRFFIICGLIGLALLLIIIVVVLLRAKKESPFDPDGFEKGKKDKKPSNHKAKKGSVLDFLEEDAQDEYDEYYDDLDEEDLEGDEDEGDSRPSGRRSHEEPAVRSPQYSSHPAARAPRYEKQYEEDFEEMEDLEEVERSLAAKLAREAEAAELEAERVGERKYQNTAQRYAAVTAQEAAGRRGPLQEPVRRQTQERYSGHEPVRYPASDQVSQRYPVREQEPARPRDQEQVSHVQDQTSARRPVQGRPPVRDQEPVRRPAQDQAAVRRPAQEQEPVRRPVREQEPVRRPLQDQEPVRYPAQEQEPVRRPAQEREPVRRPAQEREPMRLPAQEREPMRRPAQEREPVRRSAQDQAAVRRPVLDPASDRRPAGGQDPVRRPVQGQTPQGQPESRRQLHPQSELPGRRQPSPRNSDEDDFEFLDLD